MIAKDKISQLRSLIRQSLLPLIDRDYVLLDIPIHLNVGDLLIWQGELELLKESDHKCLNSYSFFRKDISIKENTLILFQGGGNFGDIWPSNQEFRKRIIAQCPSNPIIILPQSVGYKDHNNLITDAGFFSQYPNVTICVRDYASKELLDKHFSNKVLLVPDMAFMLKAESFKTSNAIMGSSLFCKRADKELKQNSMFDMVPTDAFVQDWVYPVPPEMEKEIYWGHRIAHAIDRRVGSQYYECIADWLWNYKYKKRMIQFAIDFVSPYETVYTTRLHAGILSVILNKCKVVLFDNSYGKLSSFYYTWFEDLEGVQIHR